MATITRGYTFGSTEQLTAAKLHSLVDSATLASLVDADISNSAAITFSKISSTGAIVNADINSSAAIVDTKLAQVTTASKVHGSSITGLASVPSGAGVLPVANLPVGTTANKVVQLDGSAKLPAVDGSALTGITLLGAWASKSGNTVYQAATDGFVVGILDGPNSTQVDITGYSDGSNPPTTIRSYQLTSPKTTESSSASVFFPVRKNDYYKVTVGGGSASLRSMYFIPLGL